MPLNEKANWIWVICLLLLLILGRASSATATRQDIEPLLLRDPSVSSTRIAFSYAGDIWTADRDGGKLRRVTSGGHESKPRFSPDGSRIAFTGNHDGVAAIYTVLATGGEPHRLTFHPADLDVVAWTPDGKGVLFSSAREAFAKQVIQLFTVPAEGGAVSRVPLGRASEASFSPDATRIAYVPGTPGQSAWKRYRGGQTRSISIVNLADSTIEATIPRDNSDDFNPMWVGDRIYFLSDRGGPVTLYAYDTKSRTVTQIVKNNGLDLKSASAMSDTIIYEQFGSLHLIKLSSGSDRLLNIRPIVDIANVRPHLERFGAQQIDSAAIAPFGDRAAFAVHGEIVEVVRDGRNIRNLTRSPATVERDPAWSPDGTSIAYLSDESGEYALHIRDRRSVDRVTKIRLGTSDSFYYSPTWSPDSTKLGYTDKRLNYCYVDVRTKVIVQIDKDTYADPGQGRQLVWSQDGQWLAYTKQLPSHFHALFLYSLQQERSYQITDGMSDVRYPAFDRHGTYLYFTASTDLALSAGWSDMSRYERPVTRRVYAVLLGHDVASPSAPRNDREDPYGNEPDPLINSRTQRRERVIDIQDMDHRIVSLPIPPHNYTGLVAGPPGTIFLLEGPPFDPLRSSRTGRNILSAAKLDRFDLKDMQMKFMLDDIVSFQVSATGQQMLYAVSGPDESPHWFIDSVDANGRGESSRVPSKLPVEAVAIYVDPRAEWRHMFEQVWRNEREFFYDPNLHGADAGTLTKRYSPYLANINTREDLNYLFTEMLGNLTVGHIHVRGGDPLIHKQAGTGLLGANYTVENDRYRFTHVFASDTWNPDLSAPLAQVGGSVHVGDYLLTVNGREVRPTADVYSFFAGTSGRQVALRVGPTPDGAHCREVTVTPIESEASLRNYAWVEENRRKVDALTGGRVAYVYLPDTSAGGYASFNRYYFAQVGKEAVIVDERFNDGGSVPDYVLDYLRRPLLNYWYLREGRDMTNPIEGIFGPKVMIVNEMSGSGGDLLAWAFRKEGLGPVIGKRTWGGLVGAYLTPGDLLDGGAVSTPNFAFFTPDGTWEVENRGVAPDIEVGEDPQAARAGHDPQLEKAIDVVLELLQKTRASPRHPPYPNYHNGRLR